MSTSSIEFQPWGCVDEDYGFWYISTYGGLSFLLSIETLLEFLRGLGTKSKRQETTIKIEF